mgnify:CR=1 FL=1
MYSRYQCTVAPNHPIYYHNGTKIVEYMDNKVLQTTDSATNSNYPILFSDSTTSGNIISGTKKNLGVYINPSVNALTAEGYIWAGGSIFHTNSIIHRDGNGGSRVIQAIGDDGNGGEK